MGNQNCVCVRSRQQQVACAAQCRQKRCGEIIGIERTRCVEGSVVVVGEQRWCGEREEEGGRQVSQVW